MCYICAHRAVKSTDRYAWDLVAQRSKTDRRKATCEIEVYTRETFEAWLRLSIVSVDELSKLTKVLPDDQRRSNSRSPMEWNVEVALSTSERSGAYQAYCQANSLAKAGISAR